MDSFTCEWCKQQFRPTWRIQASSRLRFCSPQCSHKALQVVRTRRAQKPVEDRYGMPIADVLRHLYHEQGMGIRQIAKHLGKSDRTIWDWFDRLGIERRSRSEAVANQWQDNAERRDNMAQRMRELSTEWIQKYGVGYATQTAEARKKISLSKRGPRNAMYGQVAEKNPNWKGGKITYRGKGWRDIRTQILRRDNHTCQHCKKQFDRKDLDVHHIVPYRETRDNRAENLVTLCKWCHAYIENRAAS